MMVIAPSARAENIQIKQGWTLVLIVMLANLHQKVHQHATNVPRDSSEL
jgi:hypothetical protein